MLAELQELSASVIRFGLTPTVCHPWVKPFGKSDFLIVNVDAEGSVREMELKHAPESASIAKIQKDNQNSFPASKLVVPIFRLANDDPKRLELHKKNLANADRAEILGEVCRESKFAEGFSKNKKRLAQIQKFARELWPSFEPLAAENPAVAQLFSALASKQISVESFLQELARGVIAAVRRGEPHELAERALIGTTKKSGDSGVSEIPLLFDIWRGPEDRFTRVAHPKTTGYYHRVLLASGHGDADGICALTGEFQTLERDILPSPKLPSVGNTILFSANPDIPSLERYGLIGAKAYPIGKQTAETLNSTLLWITAPERQGKTWALVPRNDDVTSDLVITYLDLDPELHARLSEMLTGAEEREAVFEARTNDVINALEIRSLRSSNAVLHTLVLRRISKGQVQVELSREYEVERILEAFQEWGIAAANAPDFSLYIPGGKEKPGVSITTRTPFPGEIMKASKAVWIRTGVERQLAIGCTLSSVYDLYLGEGIIARTAAATLLTTIVTRCRQLLLRTGDQLSRYGRSVRDLPIAARYEAVLAVTILGITLYKLDRKKEFYMNDIAFLLGRMLGFADVLHANYCAVVRGGDLPPQLLGNQHYSMMSDRPARAFAVLGDRLKIYQGWAYTAKVEAQSKPEIQKAVKAAKWAVKQMGEVALKLHGSLPNSAFDDQGRAEMLLGYLSRSGKEAKEGEGDND